MMKTTKKIRLSSGEAPSTGEQTTKNLSRHAM
jgi:hypothetical protein